MCTFTIGMLSACQTFALIRLLMTECMIYRTPLFILETAVVDIQLLMPAEYIVSMLPDIKTLR